MSERSAWALAVLLALIAGLWFGTARQATTTAAPEMAAAYSVSDHIGKCDRLSAQLVAAIGNPDPEPDWRRGLIANASDRYNRAGC